MEQEQLLKQFQMDLSKLPPNNRRSDEQLSKIAESIIMKMSALKPHLTERFSSFVDWKMSITLGFVSFLVSQMIHFTFVYVNNRFLKVHRRFPFRMRVGERRVKSKPLSGVSAEDYEYLQTHPDHPIHKYAIIVPVNEIGSPNLLIPSNSDRTTPNIYPALPEETETMTRNPIYSRCA